MKVSLFLILVFFYSNLFCQIKETENLINQVSFELVPEKFEYYYLNPNSLVEQKIVDSVQGYNLLKLKLNEKFPMSILYSSNKETIKWNKYKLKDVKYPSSSYNYLKSPPHSLNVEFVKYNIDEKKYVSLVTNKKPHSLIVRKKWFWNKNTIWTNKKFKNELLKAWKKDKEINIEEKVYFNFSKPIFSEDKKYARVSVIVNKRCKGYGFTAIYKNNQGKWEKVIEYNEVTVESFFSHGSCNDIAISSY